jgi:hypothetical protein
LNTPSVDGYRLDRFRRKWFLELEQNAANPSRQAGLTTALPRSTTTRRHDGTTRQMVQPILCFVPSSLRALVRREAQVVSAVHQGLQLGVSQAARAAL